MEGECLAQPAGRRRYRLFFATDFFGGFFIGRTELDGDGEACGDFLFLF